MFAYHGWIRESVARNKPYDQFARELLLAQGSNYRSGPVNFYRTSRTDLELASSSAQVFMGIRIECARCHNHPFESWSQNDFYGLAAFFTRVRAKQAGEQNEVIVYAGYSGERGHPKTNKPVPPRVPGGEAAVVEPDTDRREKLVGWLTSPENPYFARSIVNRLWAHCFGRGIVHPVDDFRVTNPPSNGALLDTLAKELTTHRYDLKHVLRLILNSRTYQLSAKTNQYNAHDTQNFSHAIVRRLAAEQLLDAICAVTGVPEKLGPYPIGMRAVQVPDNRIGSYFLDVFGRPRREIVCECERTEDASLSQVLQLINGPLINRKIAAKEGRVAALLAANKPTAEIVAELYLAVYSRPPTAAEAKRAEGLIAQAPSKKEGCEDLLWALLNSKEFLFNH
jgi:hypothetical protein